MLLGKTSPDVARASPLGLFIGFMQIEEANESPTSRCQVDVNKYPRDGTSKWEQVWLCLILSLSCQPPKCSRTAGTVPWLGHATLFAGVDSWQVYGKVPEKGLAIVHNVGGQE